jgi:threonine aldolase
MEAIAHSNEGFSIAYGEDELSKKCVEEFQKIVGSDASVFFAFNGTGANVLCLRAMTDSFNSVLCPENAHINVDECAAPERLAGCKLIPMKAENGKVNSVTVAKELKGFGFQHHAQPKVLSISQPTELGTLYTPEEIKELANLMHEHGGYLHIDGSRIANAAAALDLPVKSFTADCGADALSFGGTKNGMMMGEAAVLFRKEFSDNFLYLRKQSAQLYSKSRFIAAQFIAYFKDNLYLSLASHSNEMARYLAGRLQEIPFIKISRPVETNGVFAYMPKNVFEKIVKKHYFYIWDEESYEIRLMCSFNTHKEDIDSFIEDLKKINL